MSAHAADVDDAGDVLDDLPVIVVGAGPVGLAAAAHLLEQGLEPLILEAGDRPGAAVREWSHVRLFSPWRYTLDDASLRLLEATGWSAPQPDALPWAHELLTEYVEPLAAVPALRDRLRLGVRVTAVSRGGRDKTHARARSSAPFVVRTEEARAGGRRVVEHRARAVVDAGGTWGRPNPAGANGLPAIGEEDPATAERLSRALPDVLGADRGDFAGRSTLVVGAGHSAVTTLLDLVRLAREEPGTEAVWAIRGDDPSRTYGGRDADGLPARGMLGARLQRAVEEGLVRLEARAAVQAMRPAPAGGLVVEVGVGRRRRELAVDRLVRATGFRPELEMLRELRIQLDPAVEAPVRLAPMIDPEVHSCGTVPAHGADALAHPEDGVFIVGMKSYGRAPTFLLATGYEQVRSVAAHLAGGDCSVRDLALPETGVCSTAAAVDEGWGDAGGDLPRLGVPTGLAHGRAGD